ncbi:DctP family TRAP transporter solute-binding subunit [Arthrobacter roseus]|uniref:DctP family TRAP transporter solute-binding subunit n=1 Tax=Arthrobacter roseus TaxID=136274 RepID=UPI001963B743|nr:DctP family TRAP transporter solute-binding subunit [Arthrobacter roseus]MBM7847832.1 C4-dicarboxylate transporter DctM subunit [Arthrobacter roseus]
MKAKYIVPFAGLAVVLAGCSGDPGASSETEAKGQTYDWDMTITVGEQSSWYEGAEKFAEVLDKESDGRMQLNLYTNEQLSGGDSVASLEQLINGEKAFSYHSTIIYAGIDEPFGAINAPFLYDSYEEADATIEASALEAYKKLGDDLGVEVLGFGESGFRQITNNVRPIESPSDLEGIKIRIPEISLFQDIYQALDANPITMTFSEVFTALQQGTIDGQENPLDVTYSSGLTEVLDYMTMWNYVYDPLILGMNDDLYESLSPEDQEIVQKAADEANTVQKASNRSREDTQLEEMKKVMEVSTLNAKQRDAFNTAMEPIYDKYESVWGAEVADAVQPK